MLFNRKNIITTIAHSQVMKVSPKTRIREIKEVRRRTTFLILEKCNWESQVNFAEPVVLKINLPCPNLLDYYIRYHPGGGGEPGINIKYYSFNNNLKFSGRRLSKNPSLPCDPRRVESKR